MGGSIGADYAISESATLLGDPEFPKILDRAKFGERLLRVQDLYRQYSRLDLTSDYDRPTAIDGLQQRLLRTMNVNGGFGILDDPNNNEFLMRSLLWCREVGIRRLKPIAFPSDRERVPSWSWMSVSGRIDYFRLELRQYDWQVIQPPWTFPSTNVSNAFRGLSRVFDLTGVRVNEEDVIFDNLLDSDITRCEAIVLGIEKGTQAIEDRKHYVLMVRPNGIHGPDGEVLYERIGAGYASGRCLKGLSKICTLV